MKIQTLLIDNYDSYTYNLYQLISEVNGVLPTVVHNDETDVATVLGQLAAGQFHNVVISPGPGSPAVPADIGLCVELFRANPDVPIFGVCLGYQALAVAYGGLVTRAPEPVHGRLSCIRHTGHAIFQGIPSGPEYQVVRYHSLIVDEASLPAVLEPIAWTLDHRPSTFGMQQQPERICLGDPGGGILMAIAHRQKPYYGVQYHPESVGTKCGYELFQNFRTITEAHITTTRTYTYINSATSPDRFPANVNGMMKEHATNGKVGTLRLAHRTLLAMLPKISGGTNTLFDTVVLGANAEVDKTLQDTVWLDSAATDRGRFSFMGGQGGPLWRRATYRLPGDLSQAGKSPGTLRIVDNNDKKTQINVFFFDWLAAEMERLQQDLDHEVALLDAPFQFWGGYVGYIGYELKAECGGSAAHAAATPDAAFVFIDRFLAVDHHTGDIHIVALYDAQDKDSTTAWVSNTAEQVMRLSETGEESVSPDGGLGAEREASQRASPCPFRLREGEQKYIANVGACMEALYNGDSYELCLTTELRRDHPPSAWGLYKVLREINPAPYAAWIQMGGTETTQADRDSLTVCCSSPERFLRSDREGLMEAKPIKGTAPRIAGASADEDAACAAALAASEKDRAENLMIVDLLRNDLGRVCEPGSVHVPSMMEVESFATVHQLVSTVRGRRRPGVSPVDAVRAAFPGGSMTGAPKVRSMAILDTLETGPRGVYSGSIGYFSVNGAFDLNIVIRTAVVHAGQLTIGAGGAIVVQSEAQAEYDEMRLKASALLRAVALVDDRDCAPGGSSSAVGSFGGE